MSIGPEWIIVLIVALLVLGPKRLPEVGSALGRTIREFRQGLNEVKDATGLEQTTTTPAATAAPVATPAAATSPTTNPVAAAPAAIAPAAIAPAAPAPVESAVNVPTPVPTTPTPALDVATTPAPTPPTPALDVATTPAPTPPTPPSPVSDALAPATVDDLRAAPLEARQETAGSAAVSGSNITHEPGPAS